LGTAIYLTDLAPVRLRQPLTSLIEMLAAVPSVVWGLRGLFVLMPILRVHVYPVLQKCLGFIPLFQGPIYGIGLLTAGIILAIMILPIITSVSREVLRSVPNLQREAAYALGATRIIWRGGARAWPRHRRNHGRDHGHRQHAIYWRITFSPGQHAGQRRGQ
jgi:phosphate transport system permease protein